MTSPWPPNGRCWPPCVQRGAPAPPQRPPPQHLSSPTRLLSVCSGLGGMSPAPPAVPPAAALDSGGDTQRFGGLQKMGRGRGFAWGGAAEEQEDGTEHPWGAAGGCPRAGNPPCSPVLCVPASRAGGRGPVTPPAPGTPGHAAGPPQGQSPAASPPARAPANPLAPSPAPR